MWELQLCYRVIWRDIPSAVIGGCAFLLPAGKYCEYSPLDYMAVLPSAFYYFLLFLYSFNLCNQIVGVKEDKINKPDRPIPSGLLTIQGAKYRWSIVSALYIIAGMAIGNTCSSLLWIIITLVYCYGGWDKHWFTKTCIAMPLGVLVQGWASWSIVHGSSWMNQQYAGFLGVMLLFVGTTGNIQDLRDVEGDYQSGRKTMPIQFGMNASRVFLSAFFAVQVVVLYFTIWSQYLLQSVTTFKISYIIMQVFMHMYIFSRTLFLDNTYSDFHHTYHFYTKLYAFTAMDLIAFL